MGKIEINKSIMISIICLLILSMGYIGISEWNKRQTEKQSEVYQAGASYGYELAIVQIIQQATTCQQIPLKFKNQTVNIIAVDCLRQ